MAFAHATVVSEEFSENGRCGYRLIEGSYNSEPMGDKSLINIAIPVGGELVTTWESKTCEEGTGWITGADGIKRKTIAHAGSRFYLEDSKGNITVRGDWKGSGKCAACKAVAERALQSALTKARSKNGGKLTETTTVIPATEKKYGPAGSVFYTEMKLEGIIKNLAETYTLEGGLRKNPAFKEHGNALLKGTAQKLFFLLVYLKNNPLQTFQAASFGVSQPKVSAMTRWLLSVLDDALGRMGLLPCRDSAELARVLADHRSKVFWLDGVEAGVQRNADQAAQKEEFSGTKRGHRL